MMVPNHRSCSRMIACIVWAMASCSDDGATPICNVNHLDLAVTVAPQSTMLDRGCLAELPCSDGAYVDLDDDTAGTQHRCDVSDVQRYGQPDQAEQVLAKCNEAAANAPCWRVVDAPACASRLLLEVVRVALAPADNVVAAYCWADCRHCAPP